MSPVLMQAAAGAVVAPLVFAAVLGPMYVCHRWGARARARGPSRFGLALSRLGSAVLTGLGWTLAGVAGLAALAALVVVLATAPAPGVPTLLVAIIVILALRRAPSCATRRGSPWRCSSRA